jgi:hypothetical protein
MNLTTLCSSIVYVSPLIASTITLIDFYLLDGWKQSARQLYSIEIHRLQPPKKRVDDWIEELLE